jgi:hypothetical protein
MATPGLSFTQSADAPSAADTDNVQNIGGTGALVKTTGKGISPIGNIAMDATQTAELLANMQDMVDQRTGAGSQFMRGLERASAWGSGGAQGPSQALAALNAQQQREDESVFGMRQQMAALKASNAQQEAFNKQRQAELYGGTGAGGTGGAELGTMGSLNQLALSALANEKDPVQYNKMKARFAELQMNPELLKPSRYLDENGNIQEAPLYKASRESGAALNPRAPSASGTAVPLESIQRAVFGQESGYGKADTSKPNYAGAMGPMQILPETFEGLKKEGLIPKDADIANPLQNKAAGDALLGKYYKKYDGDVNKTLAAYYGGEGAINKDGSINLDWRDKQNPKAPTVGEYISQVKQKAGLVNGPAQTTDTSPKRISMSEAETNLAFQREQAKTTAEASRKEIEKFKDATEVGSVNNQIYLARRLGELTTKYKDNPNIVNLLNNPDMTSAVAGLIAEGLTTPVGQISFKGLEDAFQKVMPGTTKDEINARQEIKQILKSYALEASKVASGQGAMSDFERQMFEQIAGSTSNSMDMLRRVQQVMQARANFNDKVGRAYEDSYQAGKPQDFQLFKKSQEYRTLVQQHRDSLLNITKDLEANPSGVQTQNKAAVFNYDADKEARYQKWKASQGK